MLGSLRLFRLLVPLMLLGSPALAVTPQQCKAGCKSDLKPKCEQACRQQAKKVAEQCIKEMCSLAMTRCEEMCEHPPQKKK